MKNAWKAKEQAASAAAEALKEKDLAEQAAALEPLEMGTTLGLTVTAKDKFGNLIGAATNGEVSLCNLEIKGPAKFVESGATSLKKLQLSEGVGQCSVQWDEFASLVKPGPADRQGHAPVRVLLQKEKGRRQIESELSRRSGHSRAARVKASGARPAGRGSVTAGGIGGASLDRTCPRRSLWRRAHTRSRGSCSSGS